MLVAHLGVVGCIGFPAPSESGLEECSAHAPNSSQAVAADSNSVAAPNWSVGQQWSYESREGNVTSRIEFEVAGVRDVDGAQAWCVVRRDVGDRSSESVSFLEVETLNEVWSECDERYVESDCRGRRAELDFPLNEGKTWVAREAGGDVVVLRNVTATRISEPELRPAAGEGTPSVWRIVSERPAGINPRLSTVLIYSETHGVVLERQEFVDGALAESWVLTTAP